ncbi:MAG: YbhB/YbcL family Raf kinase inhibitor-like protein [Comamonadaceae bacterium]|nr:YbhB/YbcL family Raf kinase inhibitor-like protein [Comamonadaceae bacterium]
MKIAGTILGVGIALSLAACGGGGGNPGGSGPNSTAGTGSSGGTASGLLLISSNSYADGGAMSLKYANAMQGGADVSPHISIRSAPAATKSFAIVMDDETPPCGLGARACVHWNVFNVPATMKTVDENHRLAIIQGVRVGPVTGSTFTGYIGPNPPNAHTYKMTVYALKDASTVTAQAPRYTRSQFEAAYKSVILDQMTWTGRFEPQSK